MKVTAAICLLFLMACSPASERSTPETGNSLAEDSLLPDAASPETNSLSSTQKGLKRLSDNKVFSQIQGAVLPQLEAKHQAWFRTQPQFELLFFARGELFRKNGNDHAFIVYERENLRISILIYNEDANTYSPLYRETAVENGLKSADCNFSTGVLDQSLEEELLYREEHLLKDPLSYLESPPIKIGDISEDKDIFLKEGCFSKEFPVTNTANSLCVATSSVYNNWECLTYDPYFRRFVIYYGQAFAD